MAKMTGGAKMDAFLRDMEKKITRPAMLRVGFPEGAQEPDGTSTAMVAAIQNFGSPAMGIPPRPFFTNMIRRYRGTWPPLMAKALKANDMDATKALDAVGGVIAGELRQQLRETMTPPLSPVTLMLRSMRIGKTDEPVTFAMVQEARARVAAGEQPKGLSATGSRPLVYSGSMLASIVDIVE